MNWLNPAWQLTGYGNSLRLSAQAFGLAVSDQTVDERAADGTPARLAPTHETREHLFNPLEIA